jgi:phosphoglycolate phosphatase-like HAD superfamily hydrolase
MRKDLSRRSLGGLGLAAAIMPGTPALAQQADPLPSWRSGAAKRAILDFVAATTRAGAPGFIPPPERIAVFDNDGTLWCEQPVYAQAAFAFDRVRELATANPALRDHAAVRTLVDDGPRALAAMGEHAVVEVLMLAHGGQTTEAFSAAVARWLETARHPRFNMRYDRLVYQPMLEVLRLFRARGFKNFIVSGGGVDFVRVFSERVYGIPPERVVGSRIKARFDLQDGRPVLTKLPELDFNDDKAGKPVGIHMGIGRRPVAAFGNSDGDLEMLQFTTMGLPAAARRFGLIVRHDDDVREFAYDRQGPIGRLDKALDEAPARGWTVVSMRQDWARVFV